MLAFTLWLFAAMVGCCNATGKAELEAWLLALAAEGPRQEDCLMMMPMTTRMIRMAASMLAALIVSVVIARCR